MPEWPWPDWPGPRARVAGGEDAPAELSNPERYVWTRAKLGYSVASHDATDIATGWDLEVGEGQRPASVKLMLEQIADARRAAGGWDDDDAAA